MTLPGSGGTVNFKYDAFGRRSQKSGPLGTTNYLYDGLSLLEEVDSSGNVVATYTQGGIDEPLSELRSGTASYYQEDALGSTTTLTSAAGALANTYTYDSFGKLAGSTGSLTNPFQYTGREFDSETGIHYYRARYYDQATGRFISEDPVQLVGGINSYKYVANSPANFIDPTGETVEVRTWPSDLPNSPGHAQVTIISPDGTRTVMNFYPANTDEALTFPFSSAGSYHAERGGGDLTVIEGLDEQAMLDWWKRFQANHPNFNLYGRNCSTVAGHALMAGVYGTSKISNTDANPWTPLQVRVLAKELRALYWFLSAISSLSGH